MDEAIRQFALQVIATEADAVAAVSGAIDDPFERGVRLILEGIGWNYTTWLNVAFLILAAVLVWRFLQTGGPEMLRMMNRPAHAGPG